MCTLRLVRMVGSTAVAWRWELAQLELGARSAWPQPGSRLWAACAQRLGAHLRTTRAPVVVAFDGYSLVGGVWSRRDRPTLPRGPFVMPQFEHALERRLLAAWLRGLEQCDLPAPRAAGAR
jgi:hypothetical protein